MADTERFVSTKGVDAPGNGAAAKPFRTIQYAARDLRLAAGQTGKIFVEPGDYEEAVVLTNGMQLLRSDSTDEVTVDAAKETYLQKGPPVRIVRPRPASAPNKNSSSPTWPDVLNIQGKNVLVRGMTIDGDSRPQRCVYIHDSESVTVAGCLITGSHSQIAYSGKGTGTEADPFHSDPIDEGEGAGVRVLRSKNVTLSNCVFTDNRTDLKYKQELTDTELNALESSRSYRAYDAVHKDSTMEAIRRKLRQAVPVRTGGGHVSCFDADEIVFQNCHFEGGFAGGRGGAIQFAHNAYGKCVSCFFTGNEAGVDGGAICFSDPDPNFFTRKPISFTACRFKNNRSGDDGGAVYLTTKAQATFKNCLFEDNESKSNGGALRATYGCSVVLEDCNFHRNHANIDNATRVEKNPDGGGAIAVNNSSLSMKGGKVETNSVGGFAGGGLYFITAAFNEMAEKVADITHGYTFEGILRNGYGVNSFQLSLTGVVFHDNSASDETCNEDTCSLSPRQGFSPRGAGGAIYVLEADHLPITALFDKVQILLNLSTHTDDHQKSDLVVRNVSKLVAKDTVITPGLYNKFGATFMDVDDGDVSGSPMFSVLKIQGKVFESKSSIKYT